MSLRVLKKLQGDKEKELADEVSDTETDTPVSGGARRKQLNINRYDLLNQQSHSESEVKEDDNETEAAKSCEGKTHEVRKKKKKKKKKSGKHANAQRSSEDNADVDEVERSVREVNRMLGENCTPKASLLDAKIDPVAQRKNIISIQHKHLNPNNELKRIFGSKIVQSEHKRKNRGGGGRGHVKPTAMVSCKENWPQVGKSGLSMSYVENKNGLLYFAYEHSQSYRQVQVRFFEAVESLDPDNIVTIINDHPYHVDALIQLSDLCQLSEDLAMAAELVERALYCLEYAYHPLFNVAQGNCRLDYRRQENRALYVTLFKHLMFVGGKACYRTSLEFCKLLLSLDPDSDPLGIKLAVDFYAIRAKEHRWLIDFVSEWDASKNLTQLPNFAFSLAAAHFYIGDGAAADTLLQKALLMFPGVLLPLIEKCSMHVDGRVTLHNYFVNADDIKRQPMALKQLVQVYVKRSYHIWKDSDLLPWLEKNVHEVLDKVERNEPQVKECEAKRVKMYSGPLPQSISRHILLSNIKGVSPMTDDLSGPVMSFDPLPPSDSINLYKRPKRPAQAANHSSSLGMFFRSILPNFQQYNIRPVLEHGREDAAAGALAEAGGNDDGGDLRRSVASLVDAMRDLLNNIRPEVPNDADAEENDDSEDDNST